MLYVDDSQDHDNMIMRVVMVMMTMLMMLMMMVLMMMRMLNIVRQRFYSVKGRSIPLVKHSLFWMKI